MFERLLEVAAAPSVRPSIPLALAGLLSLAPLSVACQTETGARVDRTEAAIASGTPDSEFTGACAIEVTLPPDPDNPDEIRDPRWCTCTLVADRIVLTAASCLEENLTAEECADPTNTPPCDEDIDLRFGNSFGSATTVAIERIELHRYYDPDKAPGINDLALIRLAEDPPGAPAPVPVALNDQPIDMSLVDEAITFVGYGVSDGAGDDFGTRKRLETTISSVGPSTVSADVSMTSGPCRGDSGGPGFHDFGSGPVQISINTLIGGCNPNARRTRIDLYADDFIYPFIDRYIGACALDENCVTTGCRSPDPDCEMGCLQNDVCVEDCPTRDWDCPLGVFPRGACSYDGECEEGGHCIAAVDDPEFTYCTKACETNDDCPADNGDMICNADGECEFTTPSPGSQGRPCADSATCRSGICEQDICVTECVNDDDCPAAPEGADPYRCLASDVKPGVSVCIGTIVTGGGGFCEASNGTGRGGLAAGVAVMMLLGLALAFRSRRRGG